LQQEVLPKSPSGAAVRYALNQWEALTRFLEDGDLEIDNGATERANRDIALGRGNPRRGAFVRSILGDRNALSAEEQAGLRLFSGRANCGACFCALSEQARERWSLLE
jgi:hypothetical protein